jgi:drug/metabolite transporter (DMT)-like permease
MGAARWTAAGCLLMWIVKIRGEALPPPRAWPALGILGILLIGVGNGALVWAEQTVPSGFASILVSSTPFWMIGVDRLLPDGQRLRLRHLIGLLTAVDLISSESGA